MLEYSSAVVGSASSRLAIAATAAILLLGLPPGLVKPQPTASPEPASVVKNVQVQEAEVPDIRAVWEEALGSRWVSVEQRDSGVSRLIVWSDDSKKLELLRQDFAHPIKIFRPTDCADERAQLCEDSLSTTPTEALKLGARCLVFGVCETGEERSNYYFFSLEPQVKELFRFKNVSSVAAKNARGHLEFFVADYFPDWGQPLEPRMVLCWDEKRNKLRLDEHDNSAAPDLRNLKEGFNDLPEVYTPEEIITLAPPELAEQTLNILFSGRNQTTHAHEFFNDNWPAKHRGRNAYWKMLMEKAQSSSLWHFVQEEKG